MTTIERPVVTAPARHHHPAGPAVLVAAIAAAGAAGLLAGVLTSYLQGVLPHDWNQLANSGAVWTVFAFAVALLCAGPAWAATTAGGVTLVAEVVGYYAVASPLRHIPTTHQEQLLWCVAALWIGPAAGYAAWCVRRGESPRRLVAALAVAGLVVGEGVYELRRLGYATFGHAEILAGLAVGALAVCCSRAGWGARLLAVAVAGLVALSTFGVYAQTLLM